ncbi:MAG: hypothetical protein KIS84_00985 [Dokdonella sp.]|nr:hypothetical protein [Dokdonella sp.]
MLSFGSLVSGAGYLELLLPGGLPVGNALAATGLCALAAAALQLSTPGSTCRRVAQGAVLAAILWLPVSVALAGNLALNFSANRGSAWLVLSLLTAVVVLGSLAWSVITALGAMLKRSGAA